MNTFSPGPWHRGPIGDALTVWSGDVPIISVYKFITGRDTAEANALLVISAPDLLEAAKSVVSSVPLHRLEESPEVTLFLRRLEVLRQTCHRAERC